MKDKLIPIIAKISDIKHVGHAVQEIDGHLCFFFNVESSSFLMDTIILRNIVETMGKEILVHEGQSIQDWGENNVCVKTTLTMEHYHEMCDAE